MVSSAAADGLDVLAQVGGTGDQAVRADLRGQSPSSIAIVCATTAGSTVTLDIGGAQVDASRDSGLQPLHGLQPGVEPWSPVVAAVDPPSDLAWSVWFLGDPGVSR